MRRGYKIAKERGIKLGEGSVRYKENGKDCACALGMALIGKYGPEKSKGMSYQQLDQDFKTDRHNACLLKTVGPKTRKKLSDSAKTVLVTDFVYTLNDTVKLKPNVIAEKLEKCGL